MVTIKDTSIYVHTV